MKKQKGITLIALVITIIVLLILAGIALSSIIGQDSIIKNAENVVGEYGNSATNEQELLNSLEQLLIDKINGEGGGGVVTDPEDPEDPTDPPTPTVPVVDANGLATENYTIKPDANSNVQITIPAGFAPVILATGTTQSGPRRRWKCNKHNAS